MSRKKHEDQPIPEQATDDAGSRMGRTIRKAQHGIKKVPGPSSNPATNLIIADVGMRAASIVFRRVMEKGLLRARFDRQKAREIVQGKTTAHTLASYFIAKAATRSIPGFLLVSGGLLGKAILDRGLSRGEAEARGDRTLDEVAKNADD